MSDIAGPANCLVCPEFRDTLCRQWRARDGSKI